MTKASNKFIKLPNALSRELKTARKMRLGFVILELGNKTLPRRTQAAARHHQSNAVFWC